MKQPPRDSAKPVAPVERRAARIAADEENTTNPALAARKRIEQARRAREDADRAEENEKKPVEIAPDELDALIEKHRRPKSQKAGKSAGNAVTRYGFRQTPEAKKNDVGLPLEKYSPKGRKLRKAFERPNPELAANAQDNRIRKVVSITMAPELLSQVDERCRELDVDRSTFVQAALRLALKPS